MGIYRRGKIMNKSCLNGDHAVFYGIYNQADRIPGICFRQQVGPVSFDGSLADDEFIGDLQVGKPLADQVKHFFFTPGKDDFVFRCFLPDDGKQQFLREMRAPGIDLPDGLIQLVVIHIFQHKPFYAKFDHGIVVFRFIVHG